MLDKRLFEPTCLGGIYISNRTVRSATVSSLATEDGYVTDELINYYNELAQSEIGLIITGTVGVMQNDIFDLKNLRIHDDSYINGLTKLADDVHINRSKIIAQLGHNSNLTYKTVSVPPLAPSAVKDFSTGQEATEMTKKDVEDFKVEFVKAAKRCQEVGFDGIQVHAAHGYLLSKFLTPYYNRRRDAYGGNVENRVRILIEILEGVKEICGKDFPVFAKINSSDFIERDGALSFEDCEEAVKMLSEAGYDAIEISGGLAGTSIGPARIKILSVKQEAYHREFAENIAKEITAQVVLVGGIRSLEIAEEIISETNIDAVAFSRPLISEPHLIKRWQEQSRKKSKCVSCNRCFNPDGSTCVLNK